MIKYGEVSLTTVKPNYEVGARRRPYPMSLSRSQGDPLDEASLAIGDVSRTTRNGVAGDAILGLRDQHTQVTASSRCVGSKTLIS